MPHPASLLPVGLIRLGLPLPPVAHDEAHRLGRCAAARLAMPVGAVLLDGHDNLGPLAPGGQVLLRVLGTSFAVRVSTDQPAALTAGVHAVRLAAHRVGRGDVLVLRAVAAVHAGRVASSGGADLIRVIEGEAHELDGAAAVRELTVRRLEHRWQRAHRGADAWRTPLPPWAMRLSRLLREVRGVLGPGAFELTFADDGRTCRLLGVRPQARSGRLMQ